MNEGRSQCDCEIIHLMSRQRTGREHVAAEVPGRMRFCSSGGAGSREWVEKRADEQAAVATLWRALPVRSNNP
jgi:hypothetical protein